MPLRAVLLDLDGTLADSLPALEAAYRRFLATRGQDGSREEFARLNGPAIPEIVEVLALRHGLEGERGALVDGYLREVAHAYSRDVRPVPGAAELLAKISRLGLRAALVSACPAAIAEGFLEAHGLHRYLETIVDAEGLPAGKPNPAIYRRALERLALDAGEALAVEDSPAGALAASRAGVRTLALGSAASHVPSDTAGGAVESVSDLVEAERRIEEIAGEARCRVWPVTPGFRIILRDEPPPVLSAEIEVRVMDIWQEERRREELVDGTMLSHWAFRDGSLQCRRETYRRFVAVRRDPSLLDLLDVRPIGVTGVLRVAGCVVFGWRSGSVTQYPGCLELVPSGGLGEAPLSADGTVDAAGQLLDELEEETGLPRSIVSVAKPFALVLDVAEQVYDVGFEIEAKVGSQEVEAKLQPGGEYAGFEVVPLTALERFLAAERDRIVPVSLALLEALGLLQDPSIILTSEATKGASRLRHPEERAKRSDEGSRS